MIRNWYINLMVFIKINTCLLFFHKLITIKNFSITNRLVYCKRCSVYFGMEDSLKILLPWDEEMDELHKYLYPYFKGILNKNEHERVH